MIYALSLFVAAVVFWICVEAVIQRGKREREEQKVIHSYRRRWSDKP